MDIDAAISMFLTSDDQEAVRAMLSTMEPDDMRYMHGYLNGYMDALKMVNEADDGMPCFHNGVDSDKITT